MSSHGIGKVNALPLAPTRCLAINATEEGWGVAVLLALLTCLAFLEEVGGEVDECRKDGPAPAPCGGVKEWKEWKGKEALGQSHGGMLVVVVGVQDDKEATQVESVRQVQETKTHFTSRAFDEQTPRPCKDGKR
eukprot:3014270-Amphidinium_carterae.2